MVAGDLEAVKLVSDLAANLVTIGAVLIGGFWTYRTFIQERTRWPKANLELAMSHRELTPDQTFLHVKVKIHNAGRGLMTLTDLRVDVRQVLPLADESAEALRKKTLITKDIWTANWRTLRENHHIRQWPREREGEEPEPEPRIEPGENDAFGSDFLVPSTWELVYVYVYVTNAALKGRDQLGWTVTSYYDLTGSEGNDSARNLIREAA
jgi:hypothetical protein